MESFNARSDLALIVTEVGSSSPPLRSADSPTPCRSPLTRWKYTHVIKRAAAAASHAKTLDGGEID